MRVAEKFAMLKALFPPGIAWDLTEDKQLTALVRGFAQEYARAEEVADSLIEEAFPDSATPAGLLPGWERLVGVTQPAATLEARRAEVISRLTARGGQAVGYFRGIAAALGVSVVIQEHRELNPGFCVGEYVTNGDWPYSWRVYLENGDPVPEVVRERFRINKPAHTLVVFDDRWEKDVV